jgi:hypothetical protein
MTSFYYYVTLPKILFAWHISFIERKNYNIVPSVCIEIFRLTLAVLNSSFKPVCERSASARKQPLANVRRPRPADASREVRASLEITEITGTPDAATTTA